MQNNSSLQHLPVSPHYMEQAHQHVLNIREGTGAKGCCIQACMTVNLDRWIHTSSPVPWQRDGATSGALRLAICLEYLQIRPGALIIAGSLRYHEISPYLSYTTTPCLNNRQWCLSEEVTEYSTLLPHMRMVLKYLNVYFLLGFYLLPFKRRISTI